MTLLHIAVFDPTILTQSGKTMDNAAVLFADKLYNRDSKIIVKNKNPLCFPILLLRTD
jgi:hypothetical protein